MGLAEITNALTQFPVLSCISMLSPSFGKYLGSLTSSLSFDFLSEQEASSLRDDDDDDDDLSYFWNLLPEESISAPFFSEMHLTP